MSNPPLIAHIIYRLAIGGLENGLVNLINNMPVSKYRHVIICADTYTNFKDRIKRDDVEVYALNKKPGNDIVAYWRLWCLLRKLKPAIVHTRNLGTIEYVIPSKLAGVKYCLHGEHGRDLTDICGTNPKYIKLRQFYNLFINHFVTVSKDLENWLFEVVKIKKSKISQIYNGVDMSRFAEKYYEYNEKIKIIIGTVGRLQAEKDQATLIRAFDVLNKKHHNLELHFIGDGPDRDMLENLVASLEMTDNVVFHGKSDSVPEVISKLDIFILPSLGEGISNTILEAMSCGLPVIATNVGGNPELVSEGSTGMLVPAANPEKMSHALEVYVENTDKIIRHGQAGRKKVEQEFSMDNMVKNYTNVYDELFINK